MKLVKKEQTINRRNLLFLSALVFGALIIFGKVMILRAENGTCVCDEKLVSNYPPPFNRPVYTQWVGYNMSFSACNAKSGTSFAVNTTTTAYLSNCQLNFQK